MSFKLTLGLALTLLTGLTGFAADSDDARKAFDDYKSAILTQKGTRAADLVTENTIKEYQKYVDWARTADRETLESLSLMNRFQVIIIRHRIPADELRKLDGRAAFVYAVDRDWIGKDGVIQTTVGEIETSDGRATAEVLMGGKKAPTRFQFTKEGDQWRFDLISIMRDSNGAFQEVAKKMGVTENEMIFQLLEAISGKKVPDTIWDPVK